MRATILQLFEAQERLNICTLESLARERICQTAEIMTILVGGLYHEVEDV